MSKLGWHFQGMDNEVALLEYADQLLWYHDQILWPAEVVMATLFMSAPAREWANIGRIN